MGANMSCTGSEPPVSRELAGKDVKKEPPPPSPPPPSPPNVAMDLPFRPVATLYAVSFFLTMAAGGIATYTSTNYSPETDKITLFYGIFNPCIWFDHYPAKVIATVGLGVFLVFGMIYSTMVLLYTYAKRCLLTSVWVAAVWAWVSLLDLMFLNVMTTNLYPLEGHLRRLHGVHWHHINGNMTYISLVEEGSNSLAEADINTIKMHTSFYIAWIVGQTVFSMVLANIAWGSENKSETRRTIEKCFAAIGWFGMLMHAGAMLIIVMHDEPKVDWYMKKDLQNSVQDWVIFIDAWTGTSIWGWLPIMVFRFLLPADAGVRLKFYLDRSATHDGDALPERWIGRSMRVVAAIGIMGGIFHAGWQNDTANRFKLASAMRSKPYAYFGAPMLLLAVLLLGLGLGLALVQWRLREGTWRATLMINAIALFVAIYGVTLVILERANFTDFFMAATLLAYLTWVLQLNWFDAGGNMVLAAGYVLVLAALVVLALVFEQWYFHYAFVTMLCFYTYVAPDGPSLYINLERTGDVYVQLEPAGEALTDF